MHDTHAAAETMFEHLTRVTATDEDSTRHTISIEPADESEGSVEAELDELLEQVRGSLPTDDLAFDEELLKENLEEVLLLLIALHDGTHGKELLSDLSHLFGTQLSPGTVYPCLHDLESEGVLSMHAKVRTKEYSIDDREAVRGTVERTMFQHLAFGLLLYSFLPRL